MLFPKSGRGPKAILGGQAAEIRRRVPASSDYVNICLVGVLRGSGTYEGETLRRKEVHHGASFSKTPKKPQGISNDNSAS